MYSGRHSVSHPWVRFHIRSHVAVAVGEAGVESWNGRFEIADNDEVGGLHAGQRSEHLQSMRVIVGGCCLHSAEPFVACVGVSAGVLPLKRVERDGRQVCLPKQGPWSGPKGGKCDSARRGNKLAGGYLHILRFRRGESRVCKCFGCGG